MLSFSQRVTGDAQRKSVHFHLDRLTDVTDSGAGRIVKKYEAKAFCGKLHVADVFRVCSIINFSLLKHLQPLLVNEATSPTG